jgi:hypothetical protein
MDVLASMGVNLGRWDAAFILFLVATLYGAPAVWTVAGVVHVFANVRPARVKPWLMHGATLVLALLAIVHAAFLVMWGMPNARAWLPITVCVVTIVLAVCAGWSWVVYFSRLRASRAPGAESSSAVGSDVA